jgi:hypothetical protein
VRRQAVESLEQLSRSGFTAEPEQPRRKARLPLSQPVEIDVVAVVVGAVVEPVVVL